MQPLPHKTRREIQLFNQRFADWIRLRADLEATNVVDIDRYNALAEELRTAECVLMTSHVPVAHLIWRKFECLEQVLQGDGDRADRAEIWMLAGIKADLLALGILDQAE